MRQSANFGPQTYSGHGLRARRDRGLRLVMGLRSVIRDGEAIQRDGGASPLALIISHCPRWSEVSRRRAHDMPMKYFMRSRALPGRGHGIWRQHNNL